MELKQRIVNGIGWNFCGALATQGLGMLTKIILARILFPADFGIFAMAIIAIQFLGLFVGIGLSSAVIYRKEDPQKTISTALILAVAAGIFLSVLSFVSSSFVGIFFQQPILASMVRWISIVLIFDSISTILYAGLVKELHFKRKAVVDISAIIVYSAAVLILAFYGFGAWSLIIAYIIQHVFQAIILWLMSPIKPQWSFDKEIAKEIGHFGKYSLLTLLFAWAITSLDNIFVGRKFGDASLGYYSFGFNMATLPVLGITHIITGVFHPVFAKVRDNQARIKQAYLKPLEWSLLFILPMSAGIFLLADIIVPVVFGERWLAIIPLLRVFAIYSILRTVCTIISHLLEGIGKPKIASMLLGIELFVLAVLLSFFVNIFGLIGVAYAVIIARGISMLLHLFQMHNSLSVTFIDYKHILFKKIIATAIMSSIVFIFYTLFADKTLLNLFVLVSIGVFAYIASLFIFDKKIISEAKEFIRNKGEVQ